jgi:hypothetical protein
VRVGVFVAAGVAVEVAVKVGVGEAVTVDVGEGVDVRVGVSVGPPRVGVLVTVGSQWGSRSRWPCR